MRFQEYHIEQNEALAANAGLFGQRDRDHIRRLPTALPGGIRWVQ